MIPNSLQPNLRWLTTPSSDMGRDWFQRALELDQELEGLGLDLAEETVYLIYSHPPEEILDGEGSCLVARSVIGPRREVPNPFTLLDRKAEPVLREKLSGTTLLELLEAAEKIHFEASRNGKSPAQVFTLCVRRELGAELGLSCEVIFHE